MGSRPMDPDRFWKRDIGRRVTALEKQNDYRKADLQRMLARYKDLEDRYADLVQKHEHLFSMLVRIPKVGADPFDL